MSEGDLLTLIVALSAYLATVRWFAVDKLRTIPAADLADRKSYKRFLFLLAITDLPLIASAVLLALHLFYGDWFGASAPGWLQQTGQWIAEPKVGWYKRWAIYCFGIAAVFLVAHHVYSIIRSFCEWLFGT